MNNDNLFETNPEPPADFTRRSLLVMSIASALVYLLLAWVIFRYFRETGLKTAFEHGLTTTTQLLAGGTSGLFAAVFIAYISKRPPVSEVLHDFYLVRVLMQSRFTTLDRVQLSLFAGAGEELLFRGALQPLLGIWLTSVIFVAIHGYFKFSSIGHLIFGGMMLGLSMMLGWLFESAGLIAAMSMHAVYDMIMLYLVQEKKGWLGSDP